MGWLSDLFKALGDVNTDADETVRQEAKKGYSLFGSDPDDADEDAKKAGGWGAVFGQANEDEDKADKKWWEA